MKPTSATALTAIKKVPTGITGFDELTRGGLPEGRTTLIVGGPGSGKTIFALQFLVNGARSCKEPGIFVAFEEAPGRIEINLRGFGWNTEELQPKKLFFMDAQPGSDMVQAGEFDLGGMLAGLEAQAKAMGARRVVFDALDIVLNLMPDMAARKREVYRLHEWLLASGLTGMITVKSDADDPDLLDLRQFAFMQFMVDCTVILNHRVTGGTSQRSLRVQKYRGSGFDEGEAPFVIYKGGFDVGNVQTRNRPDFEVTHERVSSGVKRLDTMLGGGYYRAASVLLTGFPGTAKTTLSGAFAAAACRRGERTLFISFDSDGAEVMRNLTSVGIQLKKFAQNGLLRMVSARTISGSAETMLVHIKLLAEEHRSRCVVIDPVSAFHKAGNESTAHSVAERLIDWAKAQRITLLCTSLLDDSTSQSTGGTPLQISTLADTWIHLNYLVQAGERNRGLSIVKSRGTHHSNQVRELLLSDTGVTLADIYTAGGDVLMGALRWEKESAEQLAKDVARVEAEVKRTRLSAEESEIVVKLKSLKTELSAKRLEQTLWVRSASVNAGQAARHRKRLRELRGADTALPETD